MNERIVAIRTAPGEQQSRQHHRPGRQRRIMRGDVESRIFIRQQDRQADRFAACLQSN